MTDEEFFDDLFKRLQSIPRVPHLTNEMFSVHVDPDPHNMTTRFSLDVSLRQLVESRFSQKEMIDYVMRHLGDAITRKVEERLMSGSFDQVIDHAIRAALAAEVKRAVVEHVNDKVEEFVNEALS